jgi:CBS domain-containing protein
MTGVFLDTRAWPRHCSSPSQIATAMTVDPLTVWIDTELREVARLMDEHTIGARAGLQGER